VSLGWSSPPFRFTLVRYRLLLAALGERDEHIGHYPPAAEAVGSVAAKPPCGGSPTQKPDKGN